jgi:hypothetical protein
MPQPSQPLRIILPSMNSRLPCELPIRLPEYRLYMTINILAVPLAEAMPYKSKITTLLFLNTTHVSIVKKDTYNNLVI